MNVNGDIFPELSLAHRIGNEVSSVAKALEAKWLKPHG
jgi:hypothetical protein